MNDEGYQPFPDISAWAAVPFDPTTYDQYAALLEQARADATEEAREHAVRTAIRYAGTDTGAIEGLYTTDRGFTRTVAIEAAHWEAAANERGTNAAQIIKDQIEAYEWVLDLVTQQRPVTEHMIRELHAMLCRSQETYVVHTEVGRQERPLPKGEYKQFPNNPTSLATGQLHHYAPPDMVAPEMQRLVASLATEAYETAHPVVQAAYLHYALAAIHPFADGNGRVSRALASVPLYRALRAPLHVFRDQRDEYLDALGRADSGDMAGWVVFVNDCVVDVADLVTATTRAGHTADRARSFAALKRLTAVGHGIRHDDLRATARVVWQAVKAAVDGQLADPEWPPFLSTRRRLLDDRESASLPPGRDGYEWPAGQCGAEFWITHLSPGAPEVRVALGVAVSTWASGPPILVLTTQSTGPLPLEERDVVPSLRETARLKIQHWAHASLDAALAELAEETERTYES